MSDQANLVVFGDERVLDLGIRDAGVTLPYTRYTSIDEVRFPREDLPLVDLGNVDPAQFQRGEASPESGRLTGDTLKAMIELALAGKLDGISFAPLNKGALHKGGWKFHDEHQMFAKLTDHTGFFGEMNVIKEFSTFRVTSHVALREAVGMITPERITSADTSRAGHAARGGPREAAHRRRRAQSRTAAKTGFSGTKRSASSARRSTSSGLQASIAPARSRPT